MIADRNLYLDKSGEHLAAENSVESASLLIARGHEIDSADVARLRLVVEDGRVMQAGEPLELSEEARAELPPLGEADPNAENVFGLGQQEEHGESEG